MSLGIGIGNKKGPNMKNIFLTGFLLISILRAQDFVGVDYFVSLGIDQKVMPGAAYAFGNAEKNVFVNSYGNFTYDKDSKTVENSDLFDLASLTKVIATTSCVMKLFEQGKLDIEKPVAHYLPDFASNNKDSILVRNLLLHNGGLPPYYTPKQGQSRESIIDSVMNIKMAYSKGTKTVYSCLNFVTLMLIVEKISGISQPEFFRQNIALPLNMLNTMYIPDEQIKNQCLPTTPELQGIVHDPLARGLLGHSGNAGLFSNITDLALFARMMLNKGTLDGIQIFKPETVEQFTTVYSSSSSRGLGWDTNIRLDQSCGPLFSTHAFGHTGYTGTSIWIDPDAEIFAIFLTNRVYPNDESNISGIRRTVNSTAWESYFRIPPQPKILSLIKSNSEIVLNFTSNPEIGVSDSTEIYRVNGEEFELIETARSGKIISFSSVTNSETTEFAVRNIRDSSSSNFSDIFSVRGETPDVLIIDGADIRSADTENFNRCLTNISSALPDDFSYRMIYLSELPNYPPTQNQLIIFVFSDDNTPEETFTKEYQDIFSGILESGGKIIVTGSEIGWALGKRPQTQENLDFYQMKLFANFISDKAGSFNLIGEKGSKLEGFSGTFSTENDIYISGFPDVITPTNGAEIILRYSEDEPAALCYKNESAGLIYLAFPFETVTGKENRKFLMSRLIDLLEFKK